MASTSILGGDITIYYPDDTNGDRQLRWTKVGGETTTYTVRTVYSAIMDALDDSTTVQYGLPIKAITPSVYQIGTIEANDPEPWFIDNELLSHLRGGSIQALNWLRVPTTNAGIIKIRCHNTQPFQYTDTDIGKTVTSSVNGDTGTLLAYEEYVIGTTTYRYVFIRPTDATTSNDFGLDDSTTGTYSGTAVLTVSGTGNQVTVGPFGTDCITSSNQLWSNIASIGTISGTEEIYLSRYVSSSAEYVPINVTWQPGHIDVLVEMYNNGSLIDNGNVTVYTRPAKQTYDYFVVNVANGGRNIIPIQSADDTQFSISDPIPFTLTNDITINTLPAGNQYFTADVDQDSTNEEYYYEIDCNNNTLSDVYKRLKEIFNGENDTLFVSDLTYKEYTGLGAIMNFTSTVNEGNLAIGLNMEPPTADETSPSVVLAGFDTGSMTAAFHNIRGDIATATSLTTFNGGRFDGLTVAEEFSIDKNLPFGQYVGGQFFGTRGVLLTNVAGADVNNYTLIDRTGTVRKPPAQVIFSLTGLKDQSEVRIFRTSDSVEVAGVELIVGGIATSPTTGVSVSGTTDNNTFTYSYVHSADTSVYIVIVNTGYGYVSINNLILGDSDQSIPIQQTLDRNYLNP